jgi:hypothetical protein
MGHTVNLCLQRLQLAHAAATATPHAEGGYKKAIYHGAQLHTAKIAFNFELLCKRVDENLFTYAAPTLSYLQHGNEVCWPKGKATDWPSGRRTN